MKESNETNHQYIPAVLLLGFIGVLILAGLVILSGLPATSAIEVRFSPPTSPVAAQITESPTPTITQTATQTPKPTWTLRPTISSTPTSTLTRTTAPDRERVPTLTPARPLSINERYVLTTLTAERMDLIARTVAEYPDARFSHPEDLSNQAYHDYFIYPSLAYQEALMRFPDAFQVERWTWGLAYALAHLGNPQAVTLYSQFISQAVNIEGYSPQSLPGWFSAQTEDLSLQVHPLDLPPNQGEMFLLEIQPGNVLYLLIPGSSANSRVIPLSERFEVLNQSGTGFTTLDLDGDGFLELAVYQAFSPEGASIDGLHLYSLDEIQPQPIQLDLPYPINYKMNATVELSSEKAPGEAGESLVLQATFYPACPFIVTAKYKWDASISAVVLSEKPVYQLQPDPANLAYCEPLLTHAEAFWSLEARREVERTLLPFWPPKIDPQGRPYPPSTLDELRFRYALSLALAGTPQEKEAAKQVLQVMLEEPADPDSSWIKAGQVFLDQLETGTGLYQACKNAPGCDLRQALMTIVLLSEGGISTSSLASLDISIRANGSFDFDQDGIQEHWLVIRPHTNDQLEFWILAEDDGRSQAIFVDTVAVDDPQPYWANQGVYPGVFQLTGSQGFRLLHWSSDGILFLEPVKVEPVLTSYTRDAVFQAEEKLLTGGSPEQVQDDLLVVLNSGRFNCLNDRICDRFWYALGLAYELSGNLVESRDTYIKLWWENSASPLTAAARMKLEIPAPTPTPSLTPTLTPTSTVTPTP